MLPTYLQLWRTNIKINLKSITKLKISQFGNTQRTYI
jgi:hypothetical protein